MGKDYSKLKRPKPSIPGFVKQSLKKRGLLEKYKKRPDYQQSGYLDWINEVQIREIKLQRLAQMLEELEQGGIYLNEEYPVPSDK